MPMPLTARAYGRPAREHAGAHATGSNNGFGASSSNETLR
eukprot:CAMPEP_0117583498 /NCGR_PEP_ID=MMETSP0784-20121206/67053_1 /TAXON_ID=39447 /ORGANISM="" /LENGTH=39 /DNA_ID= /DNA_START= /DNA_END= /DNA_ORIENTATION=